MVSAILISIFTTSFLKNYNQSSKEIHKQYYKEARKEAQDKIEKLTDFINIYETALEKNERMKVKDNVGLGISTIKDIYNNYKSFPKSMIYQKIRDQLGQIRFFKNKSGYFFVYDLKGKCISLPTTPSLEGTNQINFKDGKNEYTIQKAIKIAKTKGEGFAKWYWYKIGEKKMKKKIGYIKIFKPLGILIGAGRYEEDILNNVKQAVKPYLKSLNPSQYGYIFAYDSLGNKIDKESTPKSINNWHEIAKGEHILKNALRGAKIIPEGFFISYVSNQNSKKVAYIKWIPKLDWIVGVNVKDNTNIFLRENIILKVNLHKTIYKTILIAIGVLLVIVISFLFLFLKIQNLFKSIQNNLRIEQQKLLFQAEHDALTSLPNRIFLMDRLSQNIKHARRKGTKIAVLFLDIDNFKNINDIYGHGAGDNLLKKVATVLKSSIRSTDTVARQGGDEFIVVLDGFENPSDCTIAIKKLIKNFQSFLELEKDIFKITFSVGVSIFPNDATDKFTLLKYADMAMYKAKGKGKNTYVFYDESMQQQMLAHLKIETGLALAIKNHEFVLHYQPQIDSKTGRIMGLEALIRWNHPSRGLLSPGYFITIAEESDLIISIGNIVIEEAMRQTKEWYDKGYNPGIVSVNLATKQLNSKEIYKIFKSLLEKTGCKPTWLEVEVLERYVMKDPKKSIKTLNFFRSLGIHIAIDDFGTGYSSMNYLKLLPITKIKIDKTFVDDIVTNKKDLAIVKSIINLSKGLDLEVLAEGVETKEQHDILLELGCESIQGYYFSKPLPFDKIEVMLQNNKKFL